MALVKRRLAAILAADVAGYSRLMQSDEGGTLARFNALRAELLDPKIAQFQGRVVGSAGDSLLVEFASAVDAVQCAVEAQERLVARNVDVPEDRRIAFRMGINLGDVIADGGTIHGDGVNVAARLERLGQPGTVVVSRSIHDQVKGKLPYGFADLGEHNVKNIAEPVRAYRVEHVERPAHAAPVQAEDTPLPSKPSIAVLPFNNMRGDPEREYFSDGITEDIITELSRFKNLFVIARNSSFVFRGKAVDVGEAGRKLGVAYIVEGSVRRAANRVRVTAQLVEVATGNHLWAERYDRTLEDIFAVQDEVVQSIAAAIPGHLDQSAYEHTRRKTVEMLTAYEWYLRGLWHQNRGATEDFALALAMYLKAAELDTAYARAQAAIAFMYAYSPFAIGTMLDEAGSKARAAAEMALALDSTDASVQAFSALAYLMSGDHDRARTHSARAIALNPNEPVAVIARGVVLSNCGAFAEADAWLTRGQRLNPLAPDNYLESFIENSYMAKDFALAIETFRRWHAPPAHAFMTIAACHAQLGRQDEANAARERYEATRPEGHDATLYIQAHMNMVERPQDRELWLTGYRKAGFST